MNNKRNLRLDAATICYQVLEQGQSLSTALSTQQSHWSAKDSALLQMICYGVMRQLPQLNWILSQLVAKPLSGKQRLIHHLLLVGLYQLYYLRVPAHAAVNETVNAADLANKRQFKALLNGVLRQAQRQQEQLLHQWQQQADQSLHPAWLRKQLQQAYPEQWPQIIRANNQQPPMWLRVNPQHHTTADYLALLAEQQIAASADSELPQAIKLEQPLAVQQLPGFAQGWITVQDRSAQYAAQLLQPQNGDTILDLCAAPGGKTTHILELAPQANVLAVDVDGDRLQRVQQNLDRLQLSATIKLGDGRYPEKWCAGEQFDRILLDAPCSATGVIRRHPDIKWLRRESDIAELSQLQAEILHAIWPYLKVGGKLVYATCSVLPQENQQQIAHFLQQHADATLVAPTMQLLPDEQAGDGFFYAQISKQPQ